MQAREGHGRTHERTGTHTWQSSFFRISRVVQRLKVIPSWKSSLRIRSITVGGGIEVADFELSETVFSAG